MIGTALLLLMFGIMDLGRAYFTFLALKDAAAEGAYFGSVYPYCMTSNANCADPNNVIYRVRNNAPTGGLVDWTQAAISSTVSSAVLGGTVEVTVSYDHRLVTPFIGAIAGTQDLTLTAKSVAVVVDCEPFDDDATCMAGVVP